MSHNPLLGSRISLISKKSIRYEGTLYSISESDATVALQNVRTFGTEGREGDAQFVPPQDGVVHPYLLFRGCDIKDLHVHENKDSDDKDTKNDSDAKDTDEIKATGESADGENSKGDDKNNANEEKTDNVASDASAQITDEEKKEKRRRRKITQKLDESMEVKVEDEKAAEGENLTLVKNERRPGVNEKRI